MSVLTKNELMELNNFMLGKGAPVEIDGTGYNKPDFMSMEYLAYKQELSDYEASKIVKALLRYVNTQLTDYSDDIKETIKFYETLSKLVRVDYFDSEFVKISWNFNRNISDFIKYQADKSMVRWLKQDNGTWLLQVHWNYIGILLDQFVSEGFDTSAVEEAFSKIITPSCMNRPVSSYEETKADFTVERLKDSIDTLVVTTPYNKAVIDVFHKVPYCFFNKGKNTWEFYIEYSAKLYDELLGVNVDLSQLKPWADLVKSWDINYELADLSQFNLKFNPYKFQPEDAKRLLELRTGLNGNEVGCGKTFEQVIIGESLPMKKLVICPPTLRINWMKEIQMVNPEANVHIIYSADDFKVVDGWNIIGYNSLDKFINELEAERFQVIMIDEAHYIQAVSNSGTPESNRAFAVLRLCATAGWVYPITGTPKTNRNKNLFNILRVIKHPLTRGKWAFMNYGKIYCEGERTNWGWDFNGNSNDEELNKELTPYMVRHLKKDVLPNLKKQRVALPVEVDLREYRMAISEYLDSRKNKNSETLVALTKAKQVVAIQKAKQSVELAKQFVDEGKKVVIVTCFTEVVNTVEKSFKGNCLKIVGGMSDKNKNRAIEEFQNGTTPVIVINVVAGGVGVTLTASSIMIMNDVPWTTGEVEQAEGRIWRGGQTETAMVYYPMAVGCEMDELLIDTITYKSATINTVVDGGNAEEVDLRKLLEESL